MCDTSPPLPALVAIRVKDRERPLKMRYPKRYLHKRYNHKRYEHERYVHKKVHTQKAPWYVGDHKQSNILSHKIQYTRVVATALNERETSTSCNS